MKFLFLLLLFFAVPAWAQEEAVPYQPPPGMFDGGVEAPQDDQSVNFPVKMQERNNTMNPGADQHISQKDVKQREIIRPENVQAFLPLRVSESGFPIPPRRPAKFTASESFMRKITHDKQAEKSMINITSDPVISALANPTASQVLASIEGRETEADITLSAPSVPSQEVVSIRAQPSSQSKIVHADKAASQRIRQVISLAFDPGSAELNEDSLYMLKEKGLPLIQSAPEIMVQIEAFATPGETGEAGASRMALSRSLAVRSFLVENNLNPERLRVHTPLNPQASEVSDRVDLILLEGQKLQ